MEIRTLLAASQRRNLFQIWLTTNLCQKRKTKSSSWRTTTSAKARWSQYRSIYPKSLPAAISMTPRRPVVGEREFSPNLMQLSMNLRMTGRKSIRSALPSLPRPTTSTTSSQMINRKRRSRLVSLGRPRVCHPFPRSRSLSRRSSHSFPVTSSTTTQLRCNLFHPSVWQAFRRFPKVWPWMMAKQLREMKWAIGRQAPPSSSPKD